MRITIDIPAERVTQLFSSAVEGGDPVLRSWCVSIDLAHRSRSPNPWYADVHRFSGEFSLKIVEDTGSRRKTHYIGRRHVRDGLAIMARDYSEHFAQVMQDNIDAPCADIFLQCVLFAKEKYA